MVNLSFHPSRTYSLGMLALLRRSRLLALALLLVAPGVTGSAVQWLHPCPVEGARGSDHQHGQSHSPAHGKTCHCIGSCHTVAPLALAGTPNLITKLADPIRRVPAFGSSFVPLSTRSHLLPPATAPPLS